MIALLLLCKDWFFIFRYTHFSSMMRYIEDIEDAFMDSLSYVAYSTEAILICYPRQNVRNGQKDQTHADYYTWFPIVLLEHTLYQCPKMQSNQFHRIICSKKSETWPKWNNEKKEKKKTEKTTNKTKRKARHNRFTFS